MKAALLVLALLAGPAQDETLVRRLDSDAPDVRDAASAELARRGSEALPFLEKLLSHPSLEVRCRARELLLRLPEYALERWKSLQGYPLAARVWNALVEAVVAKRPIPAKVWEEIGGDTEAQELRLQVEVLKEDHSIPWLLETLLETGVEGIRWSACRVGIDGKCVQILRARLEYAVERRASEDLMNALVRAGAGEEAFEEVYATFLQLRKQGLIQKLGACSKSDWEKMALFLAHLRKRPGQKAAAPPKTREEAVRRVLRGPWVRGIADALGRAFANDGGIEAPHSASRPPNDRIRILCTGTWGELKAVYDTLHELECNLGGVYYQSSLLRASDTALPPGEGKPLPKELLERLGEIDDDQRRVLEEVIPHLGGRLDDLALKLLLEVARQVAQNAKR
jgi:hypothetical protein